MTTPQLRPITRPSIQLTEPPLGSSLSLSMPGRSRRESVPSAIFAQAGMMPQPPFTSRVSSNNPFMPRVSMGTMYTPQHMRLAGQALPAPPPAVRPGSRASLRRRSLGPPQGSAVAETTTAQAKAAAATEEADTAGAARAAETAGAAPASKSRRASIVSQGTSLRSSLAPPPPASALQRRSSLGFAVKPNASPGRLPGIDDSGSAVATPRVVFDPHAHRTSRAFVSNCAAWAHLLNGLLALWLVLHACLFAALGLVGAIFLIIFLAALASYALHMMLRNELAMCCEQQVPWLGLPRALEYACKNGPRPLRATAVCL
ncbi:Proton-coupled amino acid transporter-like protein CG1139, partial [Gryllus bimaculatus]